MKHGYVRITHPFLFSFFTVQKCHSFFARVECDFKKSDVNLNLLLYFHLAQEIFLCFVSLNMNSNGYLSHIFNIYSTANAYFRNFFLWSFDDRDGVNSTFTNYTMNSKIFSNISNHVSTAHILFYHILFYQYNIFHNMQSYILTLFLFSQ